MRHIEMVRNQQKRVHVAMNSFRVRHCRFVRGLWVSTTVEL